MVRAFSLLDSIHRKFSLVHTFNHHINQSLTKRDRSSSHHTYRISNQQKHPLRYTALFCGVVLSAILLSAPAQSGVICPFSYDAMYFDFYFPDLQTANTTCLTEAKAAVSCQKQVLCHQNQNLQVFTTQTSAQATNMPIFHYYHYGYIPKNNGCKGSGSGVGGNSGASSFTTNPINFAIGNKLFVDTDYHGTGSFPIIFRRTYNSFDKGWRFHYTQNIKQVSPSRVIVYRPDGMQFIFNLRGGSRWNSDPDVVDRLVWQAATTTESAGWIYTMSDNTREYFDENGRLLSIHNAQGLVQNLSYTADGNTFTVTTSDGDQLTIETNTTNSLPARITDKLGHFIEYQFNGTVLGQVNYYNRANKEYLYELPDKPWLITGIIDENGNRSNTVTYDDQDRAIMSELADGAERVDISYNTDGTTTVTNALGKRTTFTFQMIHGVKKIIHAEGEPTQTCQGTAMNYSFDANGFLTQEVDAKGVVTQFTRDSKGLELSRTEAVGLPEERIITTQWDTDLRKPLTITQGNTETRYVYNTEGLTLERMVVDLTTGNSRATRYSYNTRGLLETVDGPRTDISDTTSYSYDTEGRLSRVTNALGHVTEIVNRDTYGRPTLTRDANGLESQLSYDEKGRIIERLVGNESTSMSYDPVGNLTSVTALGGKTLSYEYDTANRLSAIIDGDGNRIDYTIDLMGNRTEEKISDASGQLSRHQQKVYDELSRLLQSIGANGQTTAYGYDRNDNRTSVTDPLQQLHQSAYDGLNRLIEQTNPLNGVTSYGYDIHNRLTSVTDPNNSTTTYIYDGLGNLVEQHSLDTGITTFTHDDAGNVLTKTDAKGQVTTYAYDALNRLTQTTYADGAVVSYSYDTAPNGIGHLAQIAEPGITITWAYDLHGRTINRTQTSQNGTQPVTQIVAWQYDANGRLSGVTYPSGLQVNYNYRKGRIDSIIVSGQPLLSTITYQPFGPISGWIWANSNQSLRGYDLDGRLISQTMGNGQRLLTYDANGNITAIGSDVGWGYSYDALNRLTAAKDPSHDLAWTYDANGNRLTQNSTGKITTYTIDTTNNRLLAADTVGYQYDANGNLIADGNHTYQFNAQDRLISVDNGDTAAYRYNALGQRVLKTALAAAPDYLARAIEAEQQAQLHRDAAATLQQQADAASQEVAQLTAQADIAQSEANNAQAQATQLSQQADSEAALAADYTALAEAWAQTAADYRAQIVPNPNWWQSLLNAIYQLLADIYQWLADDATAQAQTHQQLADDYAAQATVATQQANALQQQADSRTQQAQAKQAEADSYTIQTNNELTQAEVLEAHAAEYRLLVEQGGGGPLTTRMVYDDHRLLGEYNDDGTVRQETVWLGNLPVATVQNGTVYYIHSDHLGTPIVISDQSNVEVWRWDSDPFGTTAANEDPDGDGRTFSYNLRFPGQYFDSETGKHYNYFRDYDPIVGRYIESDPSGIRGGINTYRYAYGNPLLFKDIFGLEPDCSYYDNRCDEDAGNYYCDIAPDRCANWPEDRRPPGSDDDWVNCSRKCLQRKDKECDLTPLQCGEKGANITCISRIHVECWWECY